jgi:hypothetical protein
MSVPGGMGDESGLGGLGAGGLGMPGSSPQLVPPNPVRNAVNNVVTAIHLFVPVVMLLYGITLFVVQLGLSQACYVLLDLEEQNARIHDALQVVIGRLSAGR